MNITKYLGLLAIILAAQSEIRTVSDSNSTTDQLARSASMFEQKAKFAESRGDKESANQLRSLAKRDRQEAALARQLFSPRTHEVQSTGRTIHQPMPKTQRKPIGKTTGHPHTGNQ